MIQYFRLKTEYDRPEAIRELKGAGIQCPDFADYVPAAVQFYQKHRKVTIR
ncbi:hypothetical protein [Pseudobacillus wudalianchiensis]|uniref:hypothetical protein n=1 Tax=Pseudobacillus wudalianchiensis TaxID=1743143 RepID=UPI00159EF8D6|nr:hypothetical protein [Bacillus wudalianchiensis]